MKQLATVLKSYAKAEVYARQKGVITSGPGWGFKPSPKQRRRLQRTHTKDMHALLRRAAS